MSPCRHCTNPFPPPFPHPAHVERDGICDPPPVLCTCIYFRQPFLTSLPPSTRPPALARCLSPLTGHLYSRPRLSTARTKCSLRVDYFINPPFLYFVPLLHASAPPPSIRRTPRVNPLRHQPCVS
jgi:hypothetical protein